MNSEALIRVISLCIALAGVETLHGIARTLWLAPRLGVRRAKQLSIVSGSLLALGVCWLLVPGVGLQTLAQHLWLGAILALFMACFDIAMGRLVMRRSWAAVWSDFNPARGKLLVVGLALLVTFPALLWWLRS